MFSNDIKSFTLLNIYVLVLINVGLLILIYYQALKSTIKSKFYNKAYEFLKPRVLAYIEDENKIIRLKAITEGSFRKNVAIDIMIEYAEEKNVDISHKFKNLQYHSFLITKFRYKANIKCLKELSFMKSLKSYNMLLRATESEELDIRYMSFFALSTIDLAKIEKELVIKKLINSNILEDRIIEVLNRFNLGFNDSLELLEKEESEIGRIIFLKNLYDKEELKKQRNSDRLLKFLTEKKEVRIAAIGALCSSKNDIYVSELLKIYEEEENWEVRVAIAKGMINFQAKATKEILIKMVKDEEWWVRFNAATAISAMGEVGIYILIDLYRGKDNKKGSELAYYFLSLNKDIHETLKNIDSNETVTKVETAAEVEIIADVETQIQNEAENINKVKE